MNFPNPSATPTAKPCPETDEQMGVELTGAREYCDAGR